MLGWGNRYKGSEVAVRRVSENRDIRFNQICGDSKFKLCPSLFSVCSARSIVSLPLSIRYFLFSFILGGGEGGFANKTNTHGPGLWYSGLRC